MSTFFSLFTNTVCYTFQFGAQMKRKFTQFFPVHLLFHSYFRGSVIDQAPILSTFLLPFL